MTVAAVVIAASVESALADADGVARVRRIVDTAWSGGALPIVVISPDRDGRVAAALAGTQVTLAEPAPPAGGPVGQICRGIDIAAAEVRETSAALIWAASMCWVGPETITSLIEAHGATPDALVRAAFHGQPGSPPVFPLGQLERLRQMSPELGPDELEAAFVARHEPVLRLLELGDPGTVIDGATPRSALPPYEGPPGPVSDHSHEWGSGVTDRPEDSPVASPRDPPLDSPQDSGVDSPQDPAIPR